MLSEPQRALIALALAATTILASAETIDFPAAIYAPGTSFDDTIAAAAVELPEGWSFRDANGRANLFGGSDVYGSLTLSYSTEAVQSLNLASPKRVTVDGVEVTWSDAGKGAGYARRLDTPGWMLRASLLPYPAFEGEDASAYQQQMLKMVATAKVDLPGSGASPAPELLLIQLSDPSGTGRPFSFATSADWTFGEPDQLRYRQDQVFTVRHLIDDEGYSWLGFFEQHTGAKGTALTNALQKAVIHGQADGTDYFLLRLDGDAQGDHYLLLTTGEAGSDQVRDAIVALAQTYQVSNGN